jgi:hypothetical protein
MKAAGPGSGPFDTAAEKFDLDGRLADDYKNKDLTNGKPSFSLLIQGGEDNAKILRKIFGLGGRAGRGRHVHLRLPATGGKKG